MLIRPERDRDREAVLEIHRAAFDGEAEADLVQALREGGHIRLSLVAEDEDEGIVGHILYSQAAILTEDDPIPVLALAPMAVHPDRQREGIGSSLMEESLAMARTHRHRLVLVVGHTDYYPRFGFSAQSVAHLACPYAGPHFMGLELAVSFPEAGEVQYPHPFQQLDES